MDDDLIWHLESALRAAGCAELVSLAQAAARCGDREALGLVLERLAAAYISAVTTRTVG